MVSVDVPRGAFFFVLMVRTDEPAFKIDAGENVAVVVLGTPVTDRLTFPGWPGPAVIVMV